VRKGYRRKGVTEALIGAALIAARLAEAPALKAYPLDPELTPSASSTGYASTFSRAGFKTVAHRVPPRPMMRYDLGDLNCCSRWNSRVTARDRCSVVESTLREVINRTQHATPGTTIRVIFPLIAWR
jgi:hypothetical protein